MLVLLIATAACNSRAISISFAPSPAKADSFASIGGIQPPTFKDGTQHYTVDAGVAFRDEASNRCIPLSKFGIESAEQIDSIKMSCDCVRASIASYKQLSPAVGDSVTAQ